MLFAFNLFNKSKKDIPHTHVILIHNKNKFLISPHIFLNFINCLLNDKISDNLKEIIKFSE
jgi:hypothetical protein